jgi:hypothetical protein
MAYTSPSSGYGGAEADDSRDFATLTAALKTRRWEGGKGESFLVYFNQMHDKLHQAVGDTAKSTNKDVPFGIENVIRVLRTGVEPSSTANQFLDDLAETMDYDENAVDNGFLPTVLLFPPQLKHARHA